MDVLLAVRDPALRLALADRIRADGHRVFPAADGAAALATFVMRTTDVLVCDELLHILNGRTLLEIATRHAPYVDLVLLTDAVGPTDARPEFRIGGGARGGEEPCVGSGSAHGSVQSLFSPLPAGAGAAAVAVFGKPFDPELLCAHLQSCSARRLVQAREAGSGG